MAWRTGKQPSTVHTESSVAPTTGTARDKWGTHRKSVTQISHGRSHCYQYPTSPLKTTSPCRSWYMQTRSERRVIRTRYTETRSVRGSQGRYTFPSDPPQRESVEGRRSCQSAADRRNCEGQRATYGSTPLAVRWISTHGEHHESTRLQHAAWIQNPRCSHTNVWRTADDGTGDTPPYWKREMYFTIGANSEGCQSSHHSHSQGELIIKRSGNHQVRRRQ